jgi:hypothetical protein
MNIETPIKLAHTNSTLRLLSDCAALWIMILNLECNILLYAVYPAAIKKDVDYTIFKPLLCLMFQ